MGDGLARPGGGSARLRRIRGRRQTKERARKTIKPPVLSRLPEFSLTDHLSRSFGTHQLLGKAWIADLIQHPRSAGGVANRPRWRELQRELRRRPGWADIRLVTFTADPEHDSPDVLRKLRNRGRSRRGAVEPPDRSPKTYWRHVYCRIRWAGAGTSAGNGCWSIPKGMSAGFTTATATGQREALKRDVLTTLQERLLWQEFPWLEERRQAQTAKAPAAYESSMTFRLRTGSGSRASLFATGSSTMREGPLFSPITTTGNGLAIADVDGDGRHDIYFVSQAGGNELWREPGRRQVPERHGAGRGRRQESGSA